jgi:hypothetical protein
MSATGTTPAAPWASAVIIVVDARSTSITTAIDPTVAPAGMRVNRSW